VRINGKRVTEPGAKAAWGEDRIQVDGREIPGPTTRLYLMLNKPFGYICSMSDPQGRPLVTGLLKDVPQRLYSVGRLDFDSMGLLLLTNDGEWAHRLMHPRYRIPRTYKATVEGSVGESELDQLRRGVMLSDGPTLPARVAVLKKTGGRCQIRITIRQGRSRQVRRMLEAVGYPLIHLIRIGFGSLVLGNLKVGEYRALELEELDELNRSITDRRRSGSSTPSKKPAASASLPPIRKSKIKNPIEALNRTITDRRTSPNRKSKIEHRKSNNRPPRPSSNRKSKIENRK
jgi:23S rRNA pseudouridine2605 synthase